jgi:hypothetical protein
MNILNHFVDFRTCEMRCWTHLLGLTVELILHILKLVFHWKAALMSHVYYFRDSLKYSESVSLKQCGYLQPNFLLCLDKLHAAGESLTVTNKMT